LTPIPVIVRGGGDLASGVALRLHRAGIQFVIAELEKPLAVRRTVSFAQAIYEGEIEIENVLAKKVNSFQEARENSNRGIIPVLIESDLQTIISEQPIAIIDGRMIKRVPEISIASADLVIGLGPGFISGRDCHAVVETLRGHNLGRVFWEGSARQHCEL